jgi:hypothetical protein
MLLNPPPDCLRLGKSMPLAILCGWARQRRGRLSERHFSAELQPLRGRLTDLENTAVLIHDTASDHGRCLGAWDSNARVRRGWWHSLGATTNQSFDSYTQQSHMAL